jgi:hypothetical protein
LSNWAQSLDFVPNDTLKYQHRTGGAIDTFDLTYAIPYTDIPSTGFSNSIQLLTVDYLRSNPNLFSFSLPGVLNKKIISALPHVGFAYSFGLKGTQFLHTDYQQSFQNNLLLNLEIDRQSSNGFAANSNYANNSLKLGLFKNHKRIDLTILANYTTSTRGLNNGIVDSLSIANKIDLQGLAFATVRNSTASSTAKGIQSNMELHYNLGKDSSKIKFGPTLALDYSLLNRIYEDNSDSTRDQYQDAQIKYGIGAFVKTKSFLISAMPTHRYWRLQNSGTNSDTNELGAQFKLLFNKNVFNWESLISQNIIGAQQEFRSTNQFRIGTLSKNVSVWANFENVLPIPVQRSYFGKTLDYTTPLIKQQRMDIGLGGMYRFKNIDISARTGLLNWNNNLVWADSTWEINQFSNQNLFFFETKLHFDFGIIQWYPCVLIQTGSEFLPKAVLSGRLLIKKKVFEAKKLQLQFAIDPQINSSYTFLGYHTSLDNFFYNSGNRSGGQNYALHSSFTLGIDEFRFFVRAENIQSFWTKGSTEVLQNYYRSPFTLRLGLSWDFFN